MGIGYRFYFFFHRSTCILVSGTAIASIITGLLIVIGQTLWWILGNGWPEIPLFIPFAFVIPMDGSVYAWLVDSGSGYGLNELAFWMLENISFSVFLVISGMALLAACAAHR